MPKSKTRKSKGKSAGDAPAYGNNIGQTSSRSNLMAAVVGLGVLIAAGAFWWSNRQADNQSAQQIVQQAQQGQAILSQVRTTPSQGNGHLSPGQTKTYVEPFPTSGDHAATPTKAGFYNSELPNTNLVHSMEHGNIVIYYDNPGDAVLGTIKDWTSLYGGVWDGVVAARSPGLGEVVVMTAWTKLLRLEQFDANSAAAFLDLYRGRGPENPVR